MEAPRLEAPRFRLEAPRLAQAAPFWIRLPPARWTSHGSLCVCVVWCVSLRRLSEFRVWSRTHHATFTFKHIAKELILGRGTCEAEGERTALRSPHRSPAQVLGRVARVPVRRVTSGVGEACRRVPFWFLSESSPPPAKSCTAVPERGRGEAGAAESHLNLARPLKFLITPLPDIPSDTSFIIKMFEKRKNS